MADAPRGAFAPVPAAVRAAHPTTTPPAAAKLPPLVSELTTRLLALVDMARALPLGDTPLPEDDESTDRDDKMAALLHCMASELQALYLAARGDAGQGQAVPAVQAPAAAAMAVHQAAPGAAALTQRAGELAYLVAMASDMAARADDEVSTGAVWGLRSLLGAMRLQADSLHDMAASAEGGAA